MHVSIIVATFFILYIGTREHILSSYRAHNAHSLQKPRCRRSYAGKRTSVVTLRPFFFYQLVETSKSVVSTFLASMHAHRNHGYTWLLLPHMREMQNSEVQRVNTHVKSSKLREKPSPQNHGGCMHALSLLNRGRRINDLADRQGYSFFNKEACLLTRATKSCFKRECSFAPRCVRNMQPANITHSLSRSHYEVRKPQSGNTC